MLSRTVINLIRHTSEVCAYAPNEVIFKEGDPGNVMYIVVEGELDIIMHGKFIETVGVGGVVGELSLLDAQPRAATVTARTDALVAPIDNKRFELLIQNSPEFAIQVMQVLAFRLRQWN
jgi:CRP/FNR family transcriptional regulator, cyclic AMP receptor protein